jgi:uncharacterized protein YcgI (DUF1989 family)
MPDRISQICIAARGVAAVDVSSGSIVTVVDLAGRQGADCLAVSKDGGISCTRTTRSRNRRLFPAVGQSIYDDNERALLTVSEDTSPGPHGLLVPPCDPTMYRLRGAGCAHASCHDNFFRALATFGVRLGHVPPSICLFQNIHVSETGEVAIGINLSTAGDKISLRAECDLIFVVSACPNDVFKRPPLQPTDLELLIESSGD